MVRSIDIPHRRRRAGALERAAMEPLDELREAREALAALVASLPETRIYRPTARPGWTVKHELAHLAALDTEILHRLRAAAEGLAAVEGTSLRRLRGEAMHRAQELRLAPLRAHLEALGSAVAQAAERHGAEAAPHLQAQAARIHAAVATIRAALH
jgi:uncharacterized damage-inducible protein DinB